MNSLRLRRSTVIRFPGTDFAATAAWPDDAPGGKLPAARSRQADMSGSCNPAPQEFGPVHQKYCRVVPFNRMKRHLPKRHGSERRLQTGRNAAIARNV